MDDDSKERYALLRVLTRRISKDAQQLLAATRASEPDASSVPPMPLARGGPKLEGAVKAAAEAAAALQATAVPELAEEAPLDAPHSKQLLSPGRRPGTVEDALVASVGAAAERAAAAALKGPDPAPPEPSAAMAGAIAWVQGPALEPLQQPWAQPAAALSPHRELPAAAVAAAAPAGAGPTAAQAAGADVVGQPGPPPATAAAEAWVDMVQHRRTWQGEVMVGGRRQDELEALLACEAPPEPDPAEVRALLIGDIELLLTQLEHLLQRLERYEHAAMDWQELTSILDSFRLRWGGLAREEVQRFLDGYSRCRLLLCEFHVKKNWTEQLVRRPLWRDVRAHVAATSEARIATSGSDAGACP